MTHKVYIVGAGPGDPELLTVKAIRLLKEAEVVVYDRLIPEAILALIPNHVEKIYAGKSCRKHEMTQAEINEELVRQAQRNKKVIRLKGGDPFIFGRGGEETEYLTNHSIEFEVVPGISAASGISSYLGIPLTHRGIAHSVRFITGHKQKGEPVDLDWKGLADPGTTLVIYMGLANLGMIAENLIKSGLPSDTPAVAIQNGTTPEEKKCFCSIAEIADLTKKLEFKPPTTIIVGKVVGLSSYRP